MSYVAPVKDMLVNIQHLAKIDQITQLPGFEDASRALFAQDRDGFSNSIAHWPTDVRTYLAWLSRNAFPVQ